MAEMIMKQLVREARLQDRFVIDSAAVSTEELGNPIYPPALRKLHEKGIRVDSHRARQVCPSDYDRYDHLVCMDTSNLRWLSHLLPHGDPDGKVSLLLSHAGHHRDVSDPWYTGDFETAYNDIVLGCKALLKTLAE